MLRIRNDLCQCGGMTRRATAPGIRGHPSVGMIRGLCGEAFTILRAIIEWRRYPQTPAGYVFAYDAQLEAVESAQRWTGDEWAALAADDERQAA